MLNKQLTIVIPCKNEGINIYDCVGLISKQKYIEGANVIIADVSDEEDSIHWLERTKIDFSYNLKIKIIKGGYPAKGRLEGSKLVSTPYILFLDADIMLKDKRILVECYENILAWQIDLLTVPFETERGWGWAFRMFDITQWIGQKIGMPFAIGGFQLWRTTAYWKTGGYVETQKFAEDYWISAKCNPKKFMVLSKKGVWTSARRFKKKGIGYMIKVMIKSYINRNNSKFFDDDQNYWK
jgi:glycosyltransferase involved in cell wall biosynthesis